MDRRHYLMAAGGVVSATFSGVVTAEEHDEDNTPYETELQFGDHQLVVDHGGVSPTAYAVVEVENVGTVASGEVSVTAGWLDEAESRVGDDRARLPSLRPDETWLAHVRSRSGPEEIEDFEVTGEYETGHPRSPHGVGVAESDYRVEDEQLIGRIKNTRDEDLERLEAQGKIYDADGTVLGGGTDSERDLPAGRDWTFEIWLPRLPEVVEDTPNYEVPEPTDHDVLLDSRTHRIADSS
ncbi:FxLYD domain-containing protein [Natronobeatus ordinarius]|uniref:FxLYD domain-containing protein n=1 Tax=Natronobeatus ordinarius TaxID=2963433 RepID=UPI0020CC69F0|nr:FxLYD domain-containing protein [Natronobeatus ordinarius]